MEESKFNDMNAADRESMKKASVVFLKDGSFSSFIGDTTVASGKWKYVSKERKLVATENDENGLTVIFITSINDKKMEGQTYTDDESKKFKVVLVAANSQ